MWGCMLTMGVYHSILSNSLTSPRQLLLQKPHTPYLLLTPSSFVVSLLLEFIPVDVKSPMQRFKLRNRVYPQSLYHKSIGGHSPAGQRLESRSDFQLTSLRIHQFIERKKYDKVVDILRELSRDYLVKCLESFPFKALNKAIPDSFLIWETLLTKLHNNEDGYIPQFPYAACDELVLRVAQLLLYLENDQSKMDAQLQPNLFVQCRRVFKKVYMQYHDVLEKLMKENERLSKALYSLSLHIPLGVDSTAVSLHSTIKNEVVSSVADFQNILSHLEELVLECSPNVITEIAPHTNGSPPRNGYTHTDSAHSLTQVQIQERLHYNQCALRCMTPIQRSDNLPQLLEMLKVRIDGDKEVLTLFGSLRQRNGFITETESVEMWLRRYQSSLECAISLFRAIEKELAIRSPLGSPTLPPAIQPLTSEAKESPPFTYNRCPSWGQLAFEEIDRSAIRRNRSASTKSLGFRPFSAVDTAERSHSTCNINYKPETSSSAQDIPSATAASSPTNSDHHDHHGNGQTMAGMKKKKGFGLRSSLRRSIRRLSSSTGNVSSKSRRSMFRRSSSNGGSSSDDGDTQYDRMKKELLEARETIQSLRRRERELINRFVVLYF